MTASNRRSSLRGLRGQKPLDELAVHSSLTVAPDILRDAQ